MADVDSTKITVLSDHYKDTFTILQTYNGKRDRLFYAIVAVLGIALYGVFSRDDFGALISDLITAKLQIKAVPALTYIDTLIWFSLLGLVLRYSQLSVHINRQYDYIHDLEDALSEHFPGVPFTREGYAYLKDYPPVSQWANVLYRWIFPLLLLAVVVLRLRQEIVSRDFHTLLPWFDLVIAGALVITVSLHVISVNKDDLDGWKANVAAKLCEMRERKKKKQMQETANEGEVSEEAVIAAAQE